MENTTDCQENTIWRTIDEFPQYEISKNAEVRHKIRKKIRKISIGKRGYPVISFRKGGRQYLRTLHTIYAKAFIPNPENKLEVNHIDGDKCNCTLTNLEWVTSKENNNHARNTGLHTSDGDKRVAQYKDDTLVAIYKSASEASRVTGFNRGNICSCARGNTKLKTVKGYEWKYI